MFRLYNNICCVVPLSGDGCIIVAPTWCCVTLSCHLITFIVQQAPGGVCVRRLKVARAQTIGLTSTYLKI